MQSFKYLGKLLHLDYLMKQLNKNHNSFEQFFLYCHLLNEDTDINSKSSSKRMNSAKKHDFDKPNLLKQIVSLRENRLRRYKYRPMKNPMILWKFVTYLKKNLGIYKKNYQRYHTIQMHKTASP